MFKRLQVLALASALALSAQAQAQDVGVFDSAAQIADQAAAVCGAIVFDGQTFESQLDGHADWHSVDPRSTGSNLATHAWQSRTLNTTYVMRLGNGGCSFGIERGDSEALRARVVEAYAGRGFELVGQAETRGGRATRYAYCVREDYPRVMSIVAGEARSRPVLVVNVFRAASQAPEFC
jgi:hypothetical protein